MMNYRHFEIELAELSRSLAGMGSLVERSLAIAVAAIQSPVVEAREQARVIENQLDALETTIEDRCHKLIALQAPMAKDLRLVIAAMRITADVEQVGDLSESVAKRASWIARNHKVVNPPELATLCEVSTRMVHEALTSFLTGSPNAARDVISLEDEADRLTKRCFEGIQQHMAEHPERIREYTHLLRAVAHLESIADLAVSIAEEGVYIHQGQFIRHSHERLSGDVPQT